MSRRSKGPSGQRPAWRWRRLITREAEPLWTERLGSAGELNWMIVERLQQVRLRVEAYFSAREPAQVLMKKWGGRIERFVPMQPKPAAPVRVNDALEIAHDEAAVSSPGRLIIPYGIAFGSGEHSTTLMLLRALAAHPGLADATLLDHGHRFRSRCDSHVTPERGAQFFPPARALAGWGCQETSRIAGLVIDPGEPFQWHSGRGGAADCPRPRARRRALAQRRPA
jgi:hypothetical protein